MIDTHCHLIDPQYKKDLEEVIGRAHSIGVKKIINIGYDLKTSIAAIEMHKVYDWILPSIGIHPNETAAESIKDIETIEELCSNNKIVAIGETGLDYYRGHSSRNAQQELFIKHIRLAKKLNLPVVVHTRNSIDDVIHLLSAENYFYGVFHSFSGTIEQAKRITQLGFYLGFSGVLSFSKNIQEVFKHIPLENIVFETDAPFLAPASHRGRRNEPSYILKTLSFGASIKNLPLKELEEITDNNASKLYNLVVLNSNA